MKGPPPVLLQKLQELLASSMFLYVRCNVRMQNTSIRPFSLWLLLEENVAVAIQIDSDNVVKNETVSPLCRSKSILLILGVLANFVRQILAQPTIVKIWFAPHPGGFKSLD